MLPSYVHLLAASSNERISASYILKKGFAAEQNQVYQQAALFAQICFAVVRETYNDKHAVCFSLLHNILPVQVCDATEADYLFSCWIHKNILIA